MDNKNITESEPLVSIIIVTYNSAEFVLETLESAKAQTYQNIELIITDDGSKDATLEICNAWLTENKDAFRRTALITTEQNTGIPANCNRGIKAANGEWIKLIAGDDILINTCINNNISFIKTDSNINIVLSNMAIFTKKGEEKIILNELKKPFSELNSLNASQQHQLLLHAVFDNTPSLFVSKKVLRSVTFDETLAFIEDYPFALNATAQGFKFYYLDKITAWYRIHEGSITNITSSNKIFSNYKRNKLFTKKYIYPHISTFEIFLHEVEQFRVKTLDNLGFNRNNSMCRFINSCTVRLSPIHPYHKYKIRKIQNVAKNSFLEK